MKIRLQSLLAQPIKYPFPTFLILIIFLLPSCQKDDDGPSVQTNNVLQDIETDKSRYNPGEEVRITLRLNHTNFESIQVQYKYLTSLIKEESLAPSNSLIELNWLPPVDDFKGYAVEVLFIEDSEVIDYGSTAVDVSSDWTKFPRYGFLSKFPDLPSNTIQENIRHLNKYHINGIQFYDWHNKHHIPLPITGNTPADSWQDIARRDISFNTVEAYIEQAKDCNMASMSYNLLYGAWENYTNDGVSEEWMIYNDPNQMAVNKHDLDDNWALSDIYVANPANENWQNYIFEKTEDIYDHLDFDGWHLDQLGHRGDVYDYNGNPIDLWNTFIPFLENLNDKFPNKKMVLNAVNQYGQLEILNTLVDFAYTEVWSPNEQYKDLAEIIRTNYNFNEDLNSVLAAYVNYDLAENSGSFNEPAVLMTDAVIMSFGGSHLELGEHMLGKEYFPNDNLSMSAALEKKLIEYYDFMVSYQNILRDGGSLNLNPGITSTEVSISNWNPTIGKVATFKKEVNGITTYHFINFSGLNTLEWRDNDGLQNTPERLEEITIFLPSDQINRVSYTSPDWHDGVQEELDFTIADGKCEVTLPYLHYWGMLMIE